MVVLEEGSMLTTGHNQYLQPDYLSPLPTTLDAKKSPLALLAQTCSQIGSDSPKLTSFDNSAKKSSAGVNRSPPAAKLERTRGSPTENKHLAFKPYETNVIAKRNSQSSEESRPASKASVHSANGAENNSVSAADNSPDGKKSSGSRTPVTGRKSSSPSTTTTSNASPTAERKSPNNESKSRDSPQRSSGTSPIVRSGMEILGAHAKDANLAAAYKNGFPSGLCCPPGLADNPAFRPPLAFSQQLLGYPGAAAGNPYLSYQRIKTPAGGETLVPVCKDPYCTGCQYSMHNIQMMMGAGACPSGCTQCDHQKYGLMALSSLAQMPPPPPTSSALSYAASAAAAANSRPHVCNWIAGDSYCGKRFSNSEELLQHLRSHASLAAGDPAAAAAAASAALLAGSPHAHPLLSPSAALHRAAAAAAGGYPSPSSLSSLSSRYHPYGKPTASPLGASPYSAFNALGPYYSPYALYGQRIGAAVHP